MTSKRTRASPDTDSGHLESVGTSNKKLSKPITVFGEARVIQPWLSLGDVFKNVSDLYRLVCEYVGSGGTTRDVVDSRIEQMTQLLPHYDVRDGKWRLDDERDDYDSEDAESFVNICDDCFVGRRIPIVCTSNPYGMKQTCAKPSEDLDYGLSKWSFKSVLDACRVFLTGTYECRLESLSISSYDESTGILELQVDVAPG